jgi:heat shock protein HtpX
VHDELQRHNRRATVLLLVAGFALLFLVTLAAQFLLFGFVGGTVPTTLAAATPMLGVALVASGFGSALAWWKSDEVALRSARAVPADPVGHADLHRLVEGLSLASGLPKPRVYVVDDPAPNAFATGRSPETAAIAVTTGLMDKMERRELEAVLAHEMGHIRNHDLLAVTVAVTLAGATILLADLTGRALFWGGGRGRRSRSSRDGGAGGALAIVMLIVSILVIVLAPLAARLIRFAVSRQREYLADATSVELTRDPAAMIRALRVLGHDRTEIRTASRATAHLWIEEPLNLDKRRNRAVATHPPLEDRIARLGQLWPQALAEARAEPVPLREPSDGDTGDGPPPPSMPPPDPRHRADGGFFAAPPPPPPGSEG